MTVSSTPAGPQSLGSKIASRVREDILLGRLPPDTPVSQPQLSRRYGTSRMPARDALRQLINEGLVVATPNGAAVARLTVQDIEDAFAIMAFAHGQAARRAALNATYDELTGLTELHERLVEAHQDGRMADLVMLNWEFHRTVNRIARAPKILTVIRTVAMSMPRDHLAAFPDLIPEANAQKAAVIAAMKQRDGDAADRLMREHVHFGGTNLIAYFSEKGLLSSGGLRSR